MPTPTIKAIETRAYGCRFRSRLEARWAVFFTAMGLKWEYEPEGFDIDGTFYLPDFRVWTPQGAPIWYEVKPSNSLDDTKFALFAKAISIGQCPGEGFCHGDDESDTDDYSAPRSFLLKGAPIEFFFSGHIKGMPEAEHYMCPRCGIPLHCRDTDAAVSSRPLFTLKPGDTYFEECGFNCNACDWETPSGGGNDREPGVAGFMCYPHKGWIMSHPNNYHLLQRHIYAAQVASSSARFEHGESP